MLDTRPLLMDTDFPPIRRAFLDTLQVNLGYKCNQSCSHCHVNAGPARKEMMDRETVELVLDFVRRQRIATLDLTGGAPELNRHFRHLVREARALGVEVMDRCNLTILNEPGHEENVEKQRGKGIYAGSIEGLRKLNALGYGRDPALRLNLVYNPVGPSLPPAQGPLEADYKRELGQRFGIVFDQLFTLANMPISRFGAVLLAQGQYHHYMRVLKDNHSDANLQTVMCRTLLSVDYQGYVYDCDFNQMLKLPLLATDRPKPHLRDLLERDLEGEPIAVGEHCYGCTAGQGSSCGGALN